MTLDEEPLQEISGVVSNGSINIDGNSVVRRTCSLTLTTNEVNINSFYWGLHTKFKLYIGLKNNINLKYPDIIWFPEGTYVISSFNTTQTINNYTITIQGKDKMCYLNGEIGGVITALTHDFGTYDYTDYYGNVTNESNQIKDIIRDSVHELGHEPLWNIIINDLDDWGIELMEYRGEDPMYFLINPVSGSVENLLIQDPLSAGYIRVDGKTSMDDFVFNPLFELDLGEGGGEAIPTLIKAAGATAQYQVAKISYGETAGYRLTELTYAGDLISNAGESVTSMLDKIVKMLGNFEYFYDLEGHFVFQKKKTYTTSSWNSIVNNQDEQYVNNAAYTSAVQYSFEDSKLITSFANNPAFTNLKNDFSIWGTRKGTTGVEIPIHMRYAIDKKPTVYKAFNGLIYTTMTLKEYVDYVCSLEEQEARTFDKKPNKNGLSDEEWWELKDWAEYYRFRHGSYPTQKLGYYTTSSQINLSKYFELDAGVTSQIKDAYEGHYAIDDVIIRDGKYFTNTHGSTCAHDYQWWISNAFVAHPDWDVYFRIPGGIGKNEPPINEGTITLNISIDVDKIITEIDWRELIYQMAIDYRKHNREVDFGITLYNNNPTYVKNGLTGYENYYSDLEGFWRQIYYPGYLGTFEAEVVTSENFSKKVNNLYFQRPVCKQCQETDIYHKDVTYYTMSYTDKELTSQAQMNLRGHEDLYGTFGSTKGEKLSPFTKFDSSGGKQFWIRIEKYTPVKNLTRIQFINNPTKYYYGTTNDEWCYCPWYGETSFNENLNYSTKTMVDFNLDNYWKSDLMTSPESLNFWFDFLDSEGSELGKYGVQAVGSRPKSANDNTVKAIYFRETPNVIFKTPDDSQDQEKAGYSYIQLSNDLENLFTISGQGKSAKDVLDEWLYQYSYCIENVTIQALPVYYLQPNTRIYIRDKITQINGEYLITKITLPLTAKGTMSITATKAVDRIY